MEIYFLTVLKEKSPRLRYQQDLFPLNLSAWLADAHLLPVSCFLALSVWVSKTDNLEYSISDSSYVRESQ